MDDDVIDLSDEKTFKEEMRRLDRESTCPCAECVKNMFCEDPHRCTDYKKWRERYMKERFRKR